MSAIRSREDLDKYFAAFNRSDHDTYTAYFAPDAEISLGSFVLQGKDEILKFFINGRKRILEHIEPHKVIFSESAVALTATITFTAIVDFEEPLFDIGPPVQKGGGYETSFVVFYELNEEGQMQNILGARTKPSKVIKPR